MTETTMKKEGYYGSYGGMFVPPVLQEKLELLAGEFERAQADESFIHQYRYYLNDYVGRPSPLYYARNLSEKVGAKIYLKREDLNHTGAHKINNAVGQALLAKRMNARQIIAETGAGQHGVATATVAALFNIPCKIFMGKEDILRQKPNVQRMEMLGAEVIESTRGTMTLKDAVDDAFDYYVKNPDVFYLLGSAVGPHPYPAMVKFFQSVIGNETRYQILDKEGKLPENIFACIGGGSNAIGMFSAFLEDKQVKLFGAEGGGTELTNGNTAATLTLGKPIVYQGTYSYCLVDENNIPVDAYSISAGLDYPGVGPEHSYLKDTQRVQYFPISDSEAVDAFKLLSRLEGIIPAIESSHAVALALKILKSEPGLSVINLSGRGDKDLGRF
ncbi:MAG TPA: tryptophan synthase subunit beta [Petrotogaceae bacterium]|jgi:tryptophan synthase beta chain|nr:tryptophan synthase subunit beta [Petrotogaceae bacterium]HNY36981.1 tryptophan synthase subunit beta [Petrotogaceae bacterium]HOG34273.1 tryptophan synthase subunit beta [Petrotogaceae bacterium]HPX15443.1 tryptophan synthase subunit beta [Petrotogaceae bacterium]HQC40448.1 tryptophan synthase subunit beta [Petrotogaceae bacterium]